MIESALQDALAGPAGELIKQLALAAARPRPKVIWHCESCDINGALPREKWSLPNGAGAGNGALWALYSADDL